MVEPLNPISRSWRKIGVSTVISKKWPADSHGSLVIRMSPGWICEGGISSIMLRAAAASELMWPGVPVMACATMRASASNNAVARSPASRTTGLKAMRCSALACSLTMLIRLPHMISRSMPSTSHLPILTFCLETPVRMHADAPSAEYEDSGLSLLDDHRTDDALIARQRRALIDRNRHDSILEVDIAPGPWLGRLRCRLYADVTHGIAAVRRRAPADDFDVHVIQPHAVERLVGRIKARAQLPRVACESRVRSQSHGDLGLLAEVTHVGGEIVGNALLRQAGFQQRLLAVRHHVVDQSPDRVPVHGVDAAKTAAREIQARGC